MGQRQMDIQEKVKSVKKVVSEQQKKVIYGMQSGDERLFLMYVRVPVTQASIDKALRLIVNQVEGDVSQLSGELEEYAGRKGWLRGFE